MHTYFASLSRTRLMSGSSRWCGFWCLLGVLIALVPTAQAAETSAGMQLMRPRAIVLHVHAAIGDQRFLPALTQRLQQALAPSIHVLATDLDLAPLRPTIGTMDAALVVERVVRGLDWNQHAQTVQVLLIADDMRLQPANFNFAVSNGAPSTPHHVIVVSLARLQRGAVVGGEDRDPAITAERVAKMVIKNVARVAGYAHSDRCVFAFPRNLAELDATPAGFCEPDLSILVGAGIARQLAARP